MSTVPQIDQSSRGIRAELTKRVRKGVWGKGNMIPSRRALAKEFNVSVPTVHKAISDMIADGLLRVDAQRTFVHDAPDPPIDVTPDVCSDASRRAPNAVATKNVTIIATIRPNSDRLFEPKWLLMVDEAEQALLEAGIQPRFINRYTVEQRLQSSNHAGAETGNRAVASTLADAIIAESPDAVVTFETDITTHSPIFLSRLAQHGIPVVVAGGMGYSIAGCVSVIYDDIDGGFQAGSHLIARGCRRLLYFAPYRSAWVSGRLEGVRQACQWHMGEGMSLMEHVEGGDIAAIMRESNFMLDQTQFAYESAGRLLAGAISVDGVVAVNDDVAAGYVRAAAENGLKVGRDFLMVGFDDRAESREMGLSSMHPPIALLGKEAALAAERLINKQNSYSSVSIKFRLVARTSSALAPPSEGLE